MESAFNINTGEWEIAWPERVSRHDVVYLSPPMDPMQGLPLGNGDLGALCWCEPSRLMFQLNKCDLWDDADFGPFAIGEHGAEEACTSLMHAGRLIIEFQQPVFDVMYLADFIGRISVADASLSLQASGPLGTVRINAFLGSTGVLWLDLHVDLADPTPVEVTVEHWGSRTFSRWYSNINRDPAIGLAGTTAMHDEHGAYITQVVSGGTFACGCRAIAGEDLQVATFNRHQHAAGITVTGPGAKPFALAASVTSPLATPPLAQLAGQLDEAMARGRDALWQAHGAEWRAFWVRSLMECGDDYLDNLWHLTMYYLRSSQQGPYPGRFINGLWGWNRDVQPWNVYFHWNQQTLYWPLNAAGHHDLTTSYLNFRFAALPHGREDARAVFGAEGAFVSDLVERRGYNSVSERGNHTPVAEIALDFWRQYRFTGDDEYLRARALPYLIEAALFFESRFELRDDGRYHAKEGTALEGWVEFRDVASELTYGHALFATALAALQAADMTHSHADYWRNLAERMTPLPVIPADSCLIARDGERWVMQVGWFAGEEADGNALLAAGYRLDQQRHVISLAPSATAVPPMPDVHGLVRLLETTYQTEQPPMVYVDIFPETEYLAVFPAGLAGLAEPSSPLALAARNTAKLYAPGLGGYDRTPIVMARLGLGRETWQVLETFPARWQFYCNGFGHYNAGMRADHALRFHYNMPIDMGDPDRQRRVPMHSAPFRHMGMESMSMCACAINEALLQSYDGVMRVAPAVTATQSARFTLHAVGGFVVSAQISMGRPEWVAVRSLRGGECALAVPWETGWLMRQGHSEPVSGTCRIATVAGELLLFTPEPISPDDWQCVPAHPARNDAAKPYRDGYTQLGLPRMF